MNSNKEPLTQAQAMNRAAALCSRSEQATGDIREKLLKWGLDAQAAHAVLAELINQGFIDDRRFARAFTRDRFMFNGWGRIKIAHQLRQKGVAGELIDEAMGAIEDEQYRDKLMDILRSKWRTVKGREPRAAWAAMMRFAASRGFEADIASACVKQVTRLDEADD